MLSIPAVGATVASFNLGRIRSVIPLRWLLAGAASFIALAAFGLAAAPVLALAVVAMVLYGFGDGALIPALQDVTTSIPSEEQRASVMAAWVSAVRLGQTVGPLGVGLILARYDAAVAMMVGAALFAVVSVIYLVGPIEDSTS
jgi:predicted MFS family arabinose efflux permease